MSAYKPDIDGKLEQLASSSTCECGGAKADASFVKELESVFGKTFVNRYKTGFNPVIQEITQAVHHFLKNSEVDYLKYIVLVGEFSERRYLQQAMKTIFEKRGVQVLVPEDPQYTILKGAVLLGYFKSQESGKCKPKRYIDKASVVPQPGTLDMTTLQNQLQNISEATRKADTTYGHQIKQLVKRVDTVENKLAQLCQEPTRRDHGKLNTK